MTIAPRLPLPAVRFDSETDCRFQHMSEMIRALFLVARLLERLLHVPPMYAIVGKILTAHANPLPEQIPYEPYVFHRYLVIIVERLQIAVGLRDLPGGEGSKQIDGF